MKYSFLLVLNVVAFSANATLNPLAVRGEDVIQIPVAGAPQPEICVLPKHLDGAYSEDDLKEEKKLCKMDFYQTVAICPKTNSTNPGLDVHKIPDGMSLEKVVAAGCVVKVKNKKGVDKNAAKKIAKYKLSTSCSYAPSILAYYHLSRYMGDILNVPPAVIRTVDLKHHLAWAKKALSTTKSGSLINQTWSSLNSALKAGLKGPKRDLLLTDGGNQSYGALLQTASKEDNYKAFFNGGADNVSRTKNFRDKNPIVAKLAKSGPVAVGHEFTAANVQLMVQLRDASNMIVMDSVMSQQDRMGNIHSVERFYYVDPQDGKLKSADDLSTGDVTQLKAVKVSEMLLKDNDCGVAKENIDQQVGLEAKIAHMDPQTYTRLLELNQNADAPATQKFFSDELLFTAADYKKMRTNLASLANKLHTACKAGKLALDLDLQAHFTNQKIEASCDLK